MLDDGNIRQKPRRPAFLRILRDRDFNGLAIRHFDMRWEADRFRVVHAQCALRKSLAPVGADKTHEVETRPIQAREFRPRRIRNESELQQIVDNSPRSPAGTGASTYFCKRAALAMSLRSASHKRPSFICCSSIEVSLTLNTYRRDSLGFALVFAQRYSARKSMAYWAASAAPFFRTLSSTV